MDFTIDAYLDQLIAECEPALPASLVLTDKMNIDEWRTALRAEIKRVLGEMPGPDAPSVQILSEEKLPGFTRKLIAYRAMPGLMTPAYYLIPDEPLPGKPGMIAIHGHGHGVDDIVGIDQNGVPYPEDHDGGYHKKFALSLVKRGFHVIAPELLAFGRLRTAKDKATGNPHAYSCHMASTTLLMAGHTMLAARIRQCMSAIDTIISMGDIDSARIGCMGISGGGTMTTFTTALDDRIKACVVSGYANTFKDSILAMFHCVDNFSFGMLNVCEMPDILSMIAPRPMMWEAADEDDIFPIAAVRKAEAEVAKIYAKLGASDAFGVDEFHGEHEISGRKSFDFLVNHV